MDNIKISIIIPVYNTEKYIRRCVDSVRAQTYPGELTEIILVDDGSTDNSPAILDEIAASDSRIRVLHKENGGSSDARNRGIELAGGDYLGFVDSDDYVSPDMYLHLAEAAARTGAPIVQTGRTEVAEDGSDMPDIVEIPAAETVVGARDFLFELLMHRGDSSFCTKLVRRDLFDDMLFPTGILNEDFYLLYHMLPKAGEIVSLPCRDYHVYYRTGSNSRKDVKDKDYFPRVFTDIVVNSDDVRAFACGIWPDLDKVSVRFCLVQRLDYLLHIPISKMKSDNDFYRNVCRYVRGHLCDSLTNPYLTGRQRLYLMLFATSPRAIRRMHARLRHLE